jgi:hypothetical protein
MEDFTMPFRPAALALLLLAGGCAHRICCDTYTYGPPASYPISVSPSGTAANPVNKPISQSFTITASEQNYTGNFTAARVQGSCWIVQNPTAAAPASFTLMATGQSCASGQGFEIDAFQITDSFGQAVTTYIRST